MEHLDVILSGEFGGFISRASQLANTAARGLGAHATLAEVTAFDQLRRDEVNAAYFGYPAGTPSSQIGYDLGSACTRANNL